MTAKDYLRKIERMDVYIEQRQSEYDALIKRRTCIGSVNYSDDLVQTSPSGEGFTKISDKLIDLQIEINKEIDDFYNMKHEIINQIQQLSKVEYIKILFKKYVQYQSIEKISCELCFAYNYTCTLHGEALKEFYSKFLTNLK